VVILYGTTFWKEVLNFDALVKHGMISPEDLELFHYSDDVDSAFDKLRDGLTALYLEPASPRHLPKEEESPAIAQSRVPPG
jgi:predicted Rossmann-fold nucleotide-binding protein